MAIIEKQIKGHKYLYEEHWDPIKKKRVWKYLGKPEDVFKENVEREMISSPEKLVKDIYKTVKKDPRLKLSKKDLRYIRSSIEKTIEKYRR